jgi:ribosomal protein S18 acetylase RimI-like enzyme
MGLLIRALESSDREDVRGSLVASGAFSEEETRVALELFDDGSYPHFGAEIDGAIRGYVCLDKTPLTLSTWHIYWLCVHPDVQKRGVGRALEAHGVKFAAAGGAGRVVVETSGRPDYAGARRFYVAVGYREAGRIADYYKPGDDCVFYVKALV